MPSPSGPPVEYSLENASRFHWASVSGDLNRERIELLGRTLVGSRILDAGCGGGGYVDFLARKGLEVTGVDKFEMFLNVAREKNLRGEFRQADLADELPFPDGTFDTSYSFDVLEHLDDRAAIRELARVTRRRIIVVVPALDERAFNWKLTYCPYLDQTHLRYYTESSLRELLSTINPARVTVMPEGRVPLEGFVRREFIIRSRFKILDGLYRRAFHFFLSRSQAPDWYTGWVGIADFDSGVPA